MMARALSSSINGVSDLFGLSRANHLSPSSSSSLRYRPPSAIKMVQTQQTYWATIESDIETHLKKSIPIRHPVSVFDPMHYLTFAAPRTTAPALCIAACEVVGGDRAQAMAAAAAIHLVHAAAFTHKNIPLTDRPRPEPIEHKFNPNIELLTGDGIMPFGLELVAESMSLGLNNPDRVLRVITEISQAAGSRGVVEGQFKEMDISLSEIDVGLIEYVCKKKEGELHSCAAACGAILGGGNEEEIENLRRYGLYAGMVQGILNGVGSKNRKGLQEMVEKLKVLALKEVECFKGNGKFDGILAWFESELCNV
ncbi:OLC1v1022656C1 [Oldenlandia corymbosa var. corymbosa]|uniref:OLC1v1022656C1 n=1 Tax=Oldenlandia corymbosa var. corymbosa TaxID=529605 RepID=A0AAV1C0R2_OLDCO|nr:OLC1v1022656C1 [Oldenlandia corymbosa var. corymbosa]